MTAGVRTLAVWLAAIAVAGVLFSQAGFVGAAVATDTAPTCSNIGYTTNSSGFYEVTNVSQLQCLSDQGLDQNYVLTSDIDASGTENWNSGAGFDTMGSAGSPFSGTLDGAGHGIHGLYIDAAGNGENAALFGGVSGKIVDIGLVDADITAGKGHDDDSDADPGGHAAGLTIDNSGEIRDSYVLTSKISGGNGGFSSTIHANHNGGDGGDAGGLARTSSGTITRSTVLVSDVTGGDGGDAGTSGGAGNGGNGGDAGGLVVTNAGTVQASYGSTDPIAGSRGNGGNSNGSPGTAAGVIVTNDDTAQSSYWDYTWASTLSNGDGIAGGTDSGVTGLTTQEMQGSSAESKLSGLDFTGNWESVAGDYPTLQTNPRSQSTPHESAPSDTEQATILDDMELHDGKYNVTSDKALQALGRNSTTLGRDYRLVTDVDASGTGSWNSGAGFEPLGTFTGTFGGDSHAISDLYIDRGSTTRVGLFSKVDGGTVTDLTLVQPAITGSQDVGGITGDLDSGGVVTRVSVTGGTIAGVGGGGGETELGGVVGVTHGGTVSHVTVSATIDGGTDEKEVGGVVGDQAGSGVVNNASFTGSVTGDTEVGGILGDSNDGSTLHDAFAAGSVSGNDNVGGLIGRPGGSTGSVDVRDAYWDEGVTGQSSSASGGTKLSTGEMQNLDATVEMHGLDFYGTWMPRDGDYPEFTRDSSFTSGGDAYDSLVGGSGTSGDPYRITDRYELQRADQQLGSHYQLQNDVNITGGENWHDGKGFAPIGDDSNHFTGTFDGNGKVIGNLTIDRAEDYVGLFGYAEASGARIDDLRLNDVDVTGGSSYGAVGGLAGWFRDGEIHNVSVDGTVVGTGGDGGVGGVVGMMGDATSEGLVMDGTVTGDRRVGGVVGHTGFSTGLSVAYAQADVTARGTDEHAGGLVGYTSNNPSTFSDMYYAGDVTADSAGGVVGHLASGADHTFTDSVYWDSTRETAAVGEDDGDAGVARNWQARTTDEMQGTSAETDMGNLTFEDTWQSVADDYPVFIWEANAAGTGSVTGIDASDTSGFATGEGTVTVVATDEFGNRISSETISVDANDDGLSGISVGDTSDTDADGEATFTFEESTTGTYTVEFSAEDASITDTATVTVRERYSLSTSSGESDTTLSDAVVVDDQLTIGGPSDDIDAARVTIQNQQSGDTLSATDDHGITSAYDASTGVLALSGTASSAQYQDVLRSVEFENTDADDSTDTTDREITVSLGDSLPSEDTGHYYEFVENDAIRWDTAKSNAAGREHFGLEGYLATVTSQNENDFIEQKANGNGWLGASDEANEGDWKWVTGPEQGTQFWNGDETGSPVGGNYENWNDGEPNDSGGDEDYAHMIGPGKGFDEEEVGTWNDLPVEVASGGQYTPQGYVVEYGGLSSDPDVDLRGTKTVTLSDQTVPTLDAATRADDTTIEVTVGDNVGVDEATIDASDFSLSHGAIDTVNAAASGTDATVTVTLDSPVDTDTVTVEVVGSIADTSGNTLTSGSESVTGMDGVAPTITDFAVSNPDSQDIRVRIESGERLDAIDVTLDGPDPAPTLDRGEFTETGSGPYTYTAVYEGDSDGTYEATLETAADAAGNDGASTESNSVEVDTPSGSSSSPTPINAPDEDGDGTGEEDNDGEDGSGEDDEETDEQDGEESSGDGTDGGTGEGTDSGGTTGDGETVDPVETDEIVPASETDDDSAGVRVERHTGRVIIVGENSAVDDEAGVTPETSTVSNLANVSVDNVGLELATTDAFDLTVRTHEHDRVGQSATLGVRAEVFERETGLVSAGYVEVETTLDAEDVDRATFAFSVRKDYLDRLGVDEREVQLFHDTDGEWQERPTAFVGVNGTHYHFRSETPHFSVFAIGTGAPAFAVADATLDRERIAPGEEATVTATVTNRGGVTDATNLTLFVDGDPQEHRSMTVPPGETSSATFTLAPEGTGTATVAVGNTTVGTLTVEETGTVEGTGTSAGPSPGWAGVAVAVLAGVVLVGVVAWRRRGT